MRPLFVAAAKVGKLISQSVVAEHSWLFGLSRVRATNRKTLAPNQKQLSAEAPAKSCCFRSRENRTAIELFLAGVHSLPADLISAAKALATIDPAHQDT